MFKTKWFKYFIKIIGSCSLVWVTWHSNIYVHNKSVVTGYRVVCCHVYSTSYNHKGCIVWPVWNYCLDKKECFRLAAGGHGVKCFWIDFPGLEREESMACQWPVLVASSDLKSSLNLMNWFLYMAESRAEILNCSPIKVQFPAVMKIPPASCSYFEVALKCSNHRTTTSFKFVFVHFMFQRTFWCHWKLLLYPDLNKCKTAHTAPVFCTQYVTVRQEGRLFQKIDMG